MTAAIEDVIISNATLPRCYVLDEEHNIVLVCSPRPGKPLNDHFEPQAPQPTFPKMLGRAVRALEDACTRRRSTSMSATLGDIHLKVNLLRGSWGNHTAVIVEPARAA